MSSFSFKLPDIGEGVSEGEIVEWHVQQGDVVAEDDPMVEVMTDKATVTIGAPRAGTIGAINFAVGEVAQVGDVVVVIQERNGASAAPASASSAAPVNAPASVPPATTLVGSPAAAPEPPPAAENADGPAATAVGDIKEGLPGSNFFQSPSAAKSTPKVSAPAPVAYFEAKPLATPATRKLARDLGVDLRNVPPTRPDKRVTKDDVRAFNSDAPAATSVSPTIMVPPTASMAPTGQHKKVSSPAPVEPAAPVKAAPVEAAPVEDTPEPIAPSSAPPSPESVAPTIMPPPMETPAGTSLAVRSTALVPAEPERRVPFVGMRRKIAKRMQHTKNTAAHFTFVEECDVTHLIALRERMKPAAAAAGVKLSYLPFIVKAVCAALKKHPVLNSMLDEQANEHVFRGYYHVGIAAATPAGLMVPVIRDADRRSLLDIAREIDRLGEGAREGTLTSRELSGSTFTITSLGKQGGLFATPVLNHPEVGILGVHQMKRRPVVKNDEIVIGDVMLLSLSFDHRLVDGHIGAAFAYEIIDYLENPDRLFLEMA